MDYDFIGKLNEMLQEAKNRKQSADDSDTARHWAVVYTELEKVKAYVDTYLVQSDELVVGGSE